MTRNSVSVTNDVSRPRCQRKPPAGISWAPNFNHDAITLNSNPNPNPKYSVSWEGEVLGGGVGGVLGYLGYLV